MSRASTIAPVRPMPSTYCEKITVVRVYRLPDGAFDNDIPWQVDGYNEVTGECSEYVENYGTFERAIAGARTFAERCGFEWEERP